MLAVRFSKVDITMENCVDFELNNIHDFTMIAPALALAPVLDKNVDVNMI